MRAFLLALAALGALTAAPAMAQRADRNVDLPVVRSFHWFDFVGANDIRAACVPGGRSHLRLVYNALWEEQVRVYDILFDGADDLRPLPFDARRARLEAWFDRVRPAGMDLSPLVPFAGWDALAALRAGARDGAIEGLMLKRADSAYVAGRPKGPWFKWKRGPLTVDCVLMYAQRGHGKRSSFYSDYTFGIWRAGPHGDELVPVGKAYFGFTDAELRQIDSFVRRNTTNRFGPVREVTHTPDEGLVFEVAFEGLSRSTRHKSGLAMRFPRIARLRWDKPPREADRIETLETLADGAAMRLIAPSETDERNIG